MALSFMLAIECENDAFTGDDGKPDVERATAEVGRILEELAGIVRGGQELGSLWDANGNRVGKFEFVGSDGGQQRGKRGRR